MVNQFSARVQRIHNRERIVSSTTWCWENWIATYNRMKLDLYLTPYIKINSKWVKDLNKKPENVKVLEENIEENLYDLGIGNDFMDMTPKAHGTKQK